MILLSLFSGMLLGGMTAGFIVFSGGSILLAILGYSMIGAVGMLLSAALLAMLQTDRQDAHAPHSTYAPV